MPAAPKRGTLAPVETQRTTHPRRRRSGTERTARAPDARRHTAKRAKTHAGINTRISATLNAALGMLTLWLACASGCAVTPVDKLTEAECRGRSEGSARPTNCDQPGCWYYSFCRKALAISTGDAGTRPGPHTDASSAPYKGLDAGTGMPEDDASSPVQDSGAGAEHCAKLGCPANQVCGAQGTCLPKSDFPADYEVAIASAAVSAADKSSTCFDLVCGSKLSIPNYLCACAPDVFVTIVVNGKAIGHTSTVPDSLHPTWGTSDDPTIHVQLTAPTDMVTLVVADDDSDIPAPAKEIFRCDIDLAQFKTATLECTAPWVGISATDPTAPSDRLYRVTAGVTPAGPK